MKTEEKKPSNPDLHKGAIPLMQDRTTLRDYFAGQAISGIMSGEYFGSQPYEYYANVAYSIADAMLKQREL